MELSPVVVVNLTNENFNPSSDYYERVKWCLTNRVIQESQILMAWDTLSSDDDGTSLFMSNSIDNFPSTTLKKFNIKSERKTLRNLHVPIISYETLVRSQNKKVQLNSDSVQSLQNWLGAMHIRARSYIEGSEIDSDISNFENEELDTTESNCSVSIYEGFMTSNFFYRQVLKARNFINLGFCDWLAVSAWGFRDTPLTHPQYIDDQCCTVVLLPDDVYLIIMPNNR